MMNGVDPKMGPVLTHNIATQLAALSEAAGIASQNIQARPGDVVEAARQAVIVGGMALRALSTIDEVTGSQEITTEATRWYGLQLAADQAKKAASENDLSAERPRPSMNGYVAEKKGCRLEIADQTVNVRVRFRGSVAIPLSTIRAVAIGRWRSADLLEISTPLGTYSFALGDRTFEAATAVAAAAGLPPPVR
jgi:hypothetical protein